MINYILLLAIISVICLILELIIIAPIVYWKIKIYLIKRKIKKIEQA